MHCNYSTIEFDTKLIFHTSPSASSISVLRVVRAPVPVLGVLLENVRAQSTSPPCWRQRSSKVFWKICAPVWPCRYPDVCTLIFGTLCLLKKKTWNLIEQLTDFTWLKKTFTQDLVISRLLVLNFIVDISFNFQFLGLDESSGYSYYFI